MTYMGRETVIFKPTIAVIRAHKDGDHNIASISVRDRLIKICITNNIKKIFVISALENEKRPYTEYANEKFALVEYKTSLSEHDMSSSEQAIYVEDGFIVHSNLMEKFIHSNLSVLNSPTGQPIFSKNNFNEQVTKIYLPQDIYVTDPFYILKIDHDNLHEAQSRLFKWLAKETDGFVSKTLNRPISTLFSKFFANFPIAPIYFTALTALLAALMAYVLIKGGESGILWGCLLFHIASVADGIDGEIARAKFLSSLRGAKIDTMVDMITNILFMGSMSYALWSTYGNEYLILGYYIIALALTGVLLMTALLYFGPGGGRFDILATTIRERFDGKPHLLRIFNFCNYFLKRDAFAFLFAIYGVLGLGKYIPEFLIFGLIIWNLAIIFNAKLILQKKEIISEA
ncbi:MAG: CDP-alcohol phosphatidyltransferase family protein [Emcibacter sp.]|nr:CDP-alcohol phosphatidyltransferase family protein [Emcibacter sp.]